MESNQRARYPAEVWNGVTTDLRMPLLLPRSAGRLKVARRKSWTDNLGSSTVGASRKPKAHAAKAPKRKKPRGAIGKTYVCRACGQPKKGHVCTVKKDQACDGGSRGMGERSEGGQRANERERASEGAKGAKLQARASERNARVRSVYDLTQNAMFRMLYS